MRLIATAFLAVLVSSATLRLPLPPPRQLTHNVGKHAQTVIDSIKLIQAQIGNVKLQQQNQALYQLKGLITQAEWRADQLLVQRGRTDAVGAVRQAAQALHALADGSTGVEAGLQSALTEILTVMHQLAASGHAEQLAQTTPKSPLDELLEEIEALIDQFLPIIAPLIGLTDDQVTQIEEQVDQFVTDTEAVEHGTVDLTDGLAAMITDILEILRILGIDWTAPTDETPTDFDALLAELEAALDSLIDTLGPVLGLTDEQIQALEDDIDALVKDIEAIEHGEIDVDGGLEQILQDIVKFLHDFGVNSMQEPYVEATTLPSVIDVILDELQHIVDTYLPLIAAITDLTFAESQAIIDNFDKFVADIKGMEHGTIEIADGVIDICIDILRVLEAFGVNVTLPSTDVPTTLDEVLFWLENGLNAVLDIVGPFIGLDYDATKQVEADIHSLINDIRDLGDGHIDVDHGLENILTDILAILGDFGVPTSQHKDLHTSLDDLLRRLEEAFDALLIALGPSAGLTPAQILQAQKDMHALIETIEGIEHHNIEAQTGAERIVTELMQLLNDLGIDPQFPTSDTPTALDAALEALRATLDGALEVYGPRYGLDPYTVSRLEKDLATIELHIEDIEHGRTPLTDGLVVIVDDVFNMLRDFGVPVLPIESAVGLAEKCAYLGRQLETVLGVSHSRRPELPEPSFGRIRKLQSDLVALGDGRDEVMMFEVVLDMNMVARQFVDLL